MNVSRAGFLKICGAVLLGRSADASPTGASISDAAAALGGTGSAFQVEHATAALFLGHVNTTFTVRSAEGAGLPLRLARVTERPLTHDVEQFSLGFDAASAAPLPCGTHTLHHPTLGAFDLFMAPVGAGSRRTEYEACFSRHVGVHERSARARREDGAPGGDAACQIIS